MTGWDIKQQGVLGVLKTTAEAAGRLEKAGSAMVTQLADAAVSAGTVVQGSEYQPVQGPMPVGTPREGAPLGPVAAALNEYVQKRQKTMTFMAERTANSVSGTVKAMNAYNEGGQEMAKKAQKAQSDALLTPETDKLGPQQPPTGRR
ncbi:DUF6507 family protein [Streptomyces apocyni]|uniref:DUF6507 family protein n=1 Tax=Streptomyces apocyni TaxID=2654677 RepID=UPI0018D0CCB6|nr:DUF6507 family protein [Streptomyces apocyni]